MNFSMNPISSISGPRTRRHFGFSMVEMIACVSIIGIIAFLAIPSITRMRGDSERNLAIARAESLNLSMSTYMQVVGRTQASVNWGNASTTTAKYDLLRPYLAYSESTLTAFLPTDYSIVFPDSITSMTKARLTGPSGVIGY